MLHLFFARHGQSGWQVRGDVAGADSELTELGRRQADRLGRWLAANMEVDWIYASPLKRAYKTAQLAAAHLNLPLTVHDNLREAWFLVGARLPDFASPLDILDDEQIERQAANKDYRLFRAQVAQALRDILTRHPQGRILIIAHGGTIETALHLLLGSQSFNINIGNTTLHGLSWNGSRWNLEFFDRWEHLRGLSG